MRVKDNFIFRKIADESLLIPTGAAAMSVKGLIALSESGSFLYEKLRTGSTREALLAAMLAEYDVPPETAAADIDAFLDQMRQLDLLIED